MACILFYRKKAHTLTFTDCYYSHWTWAAKCCQFCDIVQWRSV